MMEFPRMSHQLVSMKMESGCSVEERTIQPGYGIYGQETCSANVFSKSRLQ